MGSLYWQLDDCWPVASWSSLDYFGRWKALHYYARRFHADLLLSAWAEGDDVVVHAVSDLTAPVAGRLEVELLDFSGATLWRRERDVSVAPLSAEEQLRISWAELLAGRDVAAVFLRARLVSDGREPAATSMFFAPTRELKLGRPAIRVATAAADAGFEVTLETDVLARHVRLAYEADEGRFDDNFFDLVPGRPVRVAYRPRAAVEIEAFRSGLAVQSIVDAFAEPDPER
jgi:beta-mannosidase